MIASGAAMITRFTVWPWIALVFAISSILANKSLGTNKKTGETGGLISGEPPSRRVPDPCETGPLTGRSPPRCDRLHRAHVCLDRILLHLCVFHSTGRSRFRLDADADADDD